MASPWGGSWVGWGNSWGESSIVIVPDTWGTSWAGSWDRSWAGTAITPTPRPPVLGGGRGAPRKRERRFSRQLWEEMLADLERERKEALERANAFRGAKARRQAKKAARAASDAILEALEAADTAAAVAHAGAITRSLEAAAEAKGVAEYLKRMEAVRRKADEMAEEEDMETVLMLS